MNTTKSDLLTALESLKGAFLSVGLFSFFGNLLMLTPPLYMLQLYDRVLVSRSESTLIMITLVVLFLFATMGTLEFIRSRILIRIGGRLERDLNERVFDAVMRLQLTGKEGGGAQPLRDLTVLRQYITGNGLFAFFDSPWVPIYLAVLYLFHVYYGLFATFAAIVILSVTLLNERRTRVPLNQANSESVKSFAQAASHLRNAEVVHAMGMERQLRERWLAGHYQFLTSQAYASDQASIWASTSKILRMTSQSLMLGVGAYLVIQQELTPGMMIAGSIILGRALAPLDILTSSWRGFSDARSSFRRLEQLLQAIPVEEERMNLPAPQGNLSLQGVFGGPPSVADPVLKGISLSLQKGESLGIIGPSAAGKSTLARVILGVWPARRGDVRLDGAEIANWNRVQLGPSVGYLPQDIELFDGTVAENIARFGEVDPDKVVAAARLAGVHEMILELPSGYDTVIGQAGGVLSGGQRQRVGLARAVYGDPVLVLLDEPNSNLDDQGERALVAALGELKQRGATVILITHRPAVIRCVDRILVLRDGQVQLSGTRDEVLAGLAQAQAESARGQAPKTVPISQYGALTQSG